MQYSNTYRLKFIRLAVLLLLTMLRKNLLVSFLRSMYSQFELIPFLQFRNDTTYRLTHNGQVCYLRAVLNDRFDPDVGYNSEDKRRRITIEDGAEMNSYFVYWRSTNVLSGVPIRGNGAFMIGRRGAASSGGYDFTVRVPAEVWNDEQKMAVMPSLIREYKLASKQFIILPL